MDVNQFADILKARLKQKKAPYHCSRVELAAMSEDEQNVLLLLFRTRPYFSKELATLPEYQYPVALLLNYLWLFEELTGHINMGQVTSMSSEIVRGLYAGVHADNSHGTMIDEETSRWHVPIVKLHEARSPQAQEWGETLLRNDLPGGVPDESVSTLLFVAHVPDDRNYFDEDELTQITKITYGWNYAYFGSEDNFNFMRDFLGHLIPEAEVAAMYN